MREIIGVLAETKEYAVHTFSASTIAPQTSSTPFLARHRTHIIGITGVVVCLSLFLLWQSRHLADSAQGTDEGVYLATARNLAAGHAAYREVFLPKPPLFAALLQGLGVVAGWHLAWYRLAMVACTILVLLAATILTWWWRGPVAAVAATLLLSLTPKIVYYARLFNADMPMFAAASLALLAAAYGYRRGRWWAWVLAGAGTAAAGGLKQNGLLVAAPVLLFVCWPHQEGRCITMPRGGALRRMGWLVLGLLVMLGAMAPWLRQPGLLREVLGQPLAARDTYPLAFGANLAKIASFVWLDRGLLMLAIVGVGASVRRRMNPIPVALGVWVVVNAVFLAVQTPLFSHHIPILFLPLGAFGGVGAAWLIEQCRRLAASARPVPLRAWSGAAAGAVALMAVVLLLPYMVRVDQRSAGGSGQGTQPALVGVLREYIPIGATVVTDDPFAAFRAHLRVPAWFVDTSNVRVDSGYLTAAEAIAQTEADDPDAVVFATDHLDRLPGYIAWVQGHYDEVWKDGAVEVFVHRAPG